jgi:hypothetical protein
MRHLTIAFERRRHDLPPRWDGRIVKWSEWDTSPTFVCGPRGPVRASRCEGCGRRHRGLRAAAPCPRSPGTRTSPSGPS